MWFHQLLLTLCKLYSSFAEAKMQADMDGYVDSALLLYTFHEPSIGFLKLESGANENAVCPYVADAR